MYIQYDEHELFEFFESEPTVVIDEETGIFIYSKQDKRGMRFVLDLSIYEQRCSIGLCSGEYTIFEDEIDNVEKIECNAERLKIHQKDSTKGYTVYSSPNLFMKKE